MQRVQELAELFGVSPSEIIRRAIDEYYMTTMERLSRFRNY
jgi:predicted transcriptional regulator